MEKSIQNNLQWFRLDNAAKIYPPAQTKHWMAMFRLSATLAEQVDVQILEQALYSTLQRFPSFACRLRSGLFWYYFEHIDGIPPIEKDVRNPMAHIRMKENKHFMFRVRYYENRIAVEYFHALTDGTGGLTFLLSLVREYLRIRYDANIPTGRFLLDTEDLPTADEYEDSFLKFARKETISRAEEAAYHPCGTALPLHQVLLTSGTVPTDRLIELAKSYHVSVGVFLTAVLIQSIAQKQKTESTKAKRRLPIKVSVPVNLRRFYPTNTLRNFALYVNPGIQSRLGEHSFEEILVQVKSLMDAQITEKQLNGRFSENVATERNLLIRLAPLFIKKPLLRFFRYWQGDRYISTTLSNLGNVDLPEEMSTYVKRLDFLLGQSSDQRTVCACISYGNQTVLNFSRTFAEPDIERGFFTALVRMGIPVKIESNGRCL